jgi:co-chaperonin GroES (HSP10)
MQEIPTELPTHIVVEQLQPQFDKLIIARERPDKVGSVLLPDTAKAYMSKNLGRIVAVGPNADENLKVGQAVIFGRSAGDWQKLPGSEQEVFFALDTDIICVVKE